MVDVRWSPRATKQLLRLERVDRAMVYEAVGSLAAFPECPSVKKLTNHRYQYRLRVGNYRVFFNFDGGAKIAYIEEVKKRDERTY
ncbi:MAG: type II toxin-antitoxin system RelE/ParE family toxin [Rectinemataceae bacterium]|jgi:mRNA-degrading endonuclease RelE of RelBE toxin-antitoxin system